MDRTQILEGLKEVLATIRTIDATKLADLKESTHLIEDLNVPSTEMINIVVKAEEHFDIEFEDDDIDEVSGSVKDTVDLIERTLQSAQ